MPYNHSSLLGDLVHFNTQLKCTNFYCTPTYKYDQDLCLCPQHTHYTFSSQTIFSLQFSARSRLKLIFIIHANITFTIFSPTFPTVMYLFLKMIWCELHYLGHTVPLMPWRRWLTNWSTSALQECNCITWINDLLLGNILPFLFPHKVNCSLTSVPFFNIRFI